MIRRFRIAICLFFLTFLGTNLFGQDPVFSQLFFNPLYLNPAYAGASKYIRFGIIYRNQWTVLDMPYSTYGVSYDRTIHSIKSGIGFNIVSDVEGQGVFTRTTLDAIYAYGVEPTYNSHLRFGLQTSAIMRSRNYSGLVFPDMIDVGGDVSGSSDYAGATSWNYDFSLGVAGDWENVYGGIAVHHILQPVEATYMGQDAYIPRKYTVHLGADFNLYKWYKFKEVLVFSPNVIYIQQDDFNQLNLGFYFSRHRIVAGLWLRENLSMNSHSFILTAGYSDDVFRMGYSYDFSVFQHGFRGLPTSSHEVTLGWNFEYKKGRRKYRYIKCPKF
ncbi:MAG: PorP/SprF family type IX secretion system membrane protein [Bacteroidales bacterium]